MSIGHAIVMQIAAPIDAAARTASSVSLHVEACKDCINDGIGSRETQTMTIEVFDIGSHILIVVSI